MALTLNADAQWPLVRTLEFGFADLVGLDSVALNAIAIPEGAAVTSLTLVVTEVFDSTTSDTIAVALGSAPTISATDVTALGVTESTDMDGVFLAASTYVTLTHVAGTADTATTGAGYIKVEYIEQDRSTSNVSR